MYNSRLNNNYFYDMTKTAQDSRKIRDLEYENKKLKEELGTIKNEKNI